MITFKQMIRAACEMHRIDLIIAIQQEFAGFLLFNDTHESLLGRLIGVFSLL